MRPALRFAVVMILGLGLLTWVASVVVRQTTRAWFEKDLALRGLAITTAARQALVSSWSDRAKLQDLLTEITHDERVMGTAACAADLSLAALTRDFPAQLSCRDLGLRVRRGQDGEAGAWTAHNQIESLPGGSVHVSAIPLSSGAQTLGFFVLVHDLSFVERRENNTQRFLLVAFGILAIAASAVTAIAARLSWRGWMRELRTSLRTGAQHPKFKPIMSDVRELVQRLVVEGELNRETGAWTPEQLKNTLRRHLHGEKVVILANREPYIHERSADGGVTVLHPASGVVTALEPVMRACSGTWIAHGSGSADKEMSDRHGHVHVPPGDESYVIRRVWLNAEQEKGYYYGFSNEGLWPLCHIADARPIFRSDDWQHYRDVNEKFAETLCEEVDSEDPIVLVQDYHFALAPQLIRERLPHATVIMFWHIPWPNSQRFGICPWRKEILEGMLGASILGFHTQFDCNNFIGSVDRFLEARIDRELNAVVQHGRPTLVRAYPISVDWPSHWAKSTPPSDECRARIFQQLDLRPDALLGVGVDRLDYTKGIEERLLAVERLLERVPSLRGRFTFVQLAAPSRTIIERYRQLNDSVERLTARINDRFGRGSYRPVILQRSHHEPPMIFQYYRAADVCYVSSLHDGMNLVAKEFVAARDDESGVLVLSQFTGAARELTEALIVNPYDLDEASAALAAAVNMSNDEKRERMRSMRAFVSEFNVYRWAGRMLVDAARVRSRDRLTGRLTDPMMLAG